MGKPELPPSTIAAFSQDSQLSNSSAKSHGPRLQYSSSNISASTLPDTDLTSPSSSVEALVQLSQGSALGGIAGERKMVSKPPDPTTPGTDAQMKDGYISGTTSSKTSPASVDASHVSHGTKRTASGAVKMPAVSTVEGNRPSSMPQQGGHSRNTSVMSVATNGSSISEVMTSKRVRVCMP